MKNLKIRFQYEELIIFSQNFKTSQEHIKSSTTQEFILLWKLLNQSWYNIGTHFYKTQHEHCIEWLVFHAKTKVCHLYQEIFSSHNWVKLILDQYSRQIYFLLLSKLHIFVNCDYLKKISWKYRCIIHHVYSSRNYFTPNWNSHSLMR